MSDETEIQVKKLQAYVPVSCCQLTDATGENHCEHPPPPAPPLRWRVKWAIAGWWGRLRMRVGSWIAGTDLDERSDW